MVDSWAKQVIENGPRNYIAQYNLLFAATSPLTDYVAADGSAAGDMGVSFAGNILFPLTNLKIWRLDYDMSASQALEVKFDATTDAIAVIVNGQGDGNRDFMRQGGLQIPAGLSGATGKILFTTLGTVTAGDFVSVRMWCKKDIDQR